MNLSTALKRKNRAISDLEQKKRLLTGNNVAEDGNDLDYSASDLRTEVEQSLAVLVKLKAAISIANAPIQAKIFEISELKGLIKLYEGLPTKHGSFSEQIGYSEDLRTREFVATIRRKDADDIVKELQSRIDKLQDEIDAHNHSTEIEL